MHPRFVPRPLTPKRHLLPRSRLRLPMKQLDRVAAGAVSVAPADLQQAASAAADVATAAKSAKIAAPITMGFFLT